MKILGLFIMPIKVIKYISVLMALMSMSGICEALRPRDVIAVGEAKMCEYEVRKKVYRYYYDNKSTLNVRGGSLQGLLKDYIVEEACLLAEAYRLKYDKNPRVLMLADAMVRTIITQERGVFFDSAIKAGVRVSEKEIDAAYVYSRSYYDVECIKFTDMGEVRKIAGREGIADVPDFVKAQRKLAGMGRPSMRIHGCWPFQDYIEYQRHFVDIDQGAVAGPALINGNTCYFYLKIKSPIRAAVSQRSRQDIKRDLVSIRESEEWKALLSKIDASARLVLVSEAMDRLLTIYHDQNDIRSFDEGRFGTIGDHVLFRFTMNGKTVAVHVNDFIRYYNNRPLRDVIINRQKLVGVIKQYLYEEYILEYARERGLESDCVFSADRVCNFHDLMVKQFIEDCANNTVTERETLQNLYGNMREQLSDGSEVVASIYTFRAWDEALRAFSKLNSPLKHEQALREIDAYKGKKDVLIRYGDGLLDPCLVSIVFSNNDSTVTWPYKVSGKIYVIEKKMERGRRIKSFQEAYDTLSKMRQNQTVREMRRKVVSRMMYEKKVQIRHRELNTIISSIPNQGGFK